MLYCERDEQWKIADFGITTVFHTKSAQITAYRRGSENYRAPEILLEPAVVTKKAVILNPTKFGLKKTFAEKSVICSLLI